MSNTPRLVDQLADLTAIRDLELLEFSLLKTLYGFLMPRELKLLKVDMKSRPRREIAFGKISCTVRMDDIIISDEVYAAIDYLISSRSLQHMIKIGDDVLTVYSLHETRTTRAYLLTVSSAHASKLDAHLVSGMLQIYRNFCDLLHESQTDELTGLANRKTFDLCINKVYEFIVPDNIEFPQEKRREVPLSYWLVMIDIDHFKSVNDHYGHLFGDEVLVTLGHMLKSAFRDDDMVFRFGGEEFVVILRCPDQSACSISLERFRLAVSTREFPQVGQVTISLGVTRMLRETFVMTQLDYADQALYYSKKNGRNKLTFFEDMLSAGVATQAVTPSSSTVFF